MALGDGIRRNVATIDPGERNLLRDAMIALHSRRFPGGRDDPAPGDVSYWFKQDEIHQATHVHDGPAFLPWHRELCNRFEMLLRDIDQRLAGGRGRRRPHSSHFPRRPQVPEQQVESEKQPKPIGMQHVPTKPTLALQNESPQQWSSNVAQVPLTLVQHPSALHTSLLGHALLHSPQWFASVVRLTQSPEQTFNGLGQTQEPPMQSSRNPQTVVQEPQASGSVCKSRHDPAHAVWPAGQTLVIGWASTHLLPAQTWPRGQHRLPQARRPLGQRQRRPRHWAPPQHLACFRRFGLHFLPGRMHRAAASASRTWPRSRPMVPATLSVVAARRVMSVASDWVS